MLGLHLLDTTEKVEHFEILKCNAPVLEAFFILDGCAWQYAGMGDLVGLDYSAAKIIWDYAGIVLDSETFKGVMIFSRTVTEELNKKKE